MKNIYQLLDEAKYEQKNYANLAKFGGFIQNIPRQSRNMAYMYVKFPYKKNICWFIGSLRIWKKMVYYSISSNLTWKFYQISCYVF